MPDGGGFHQRRDLSQKQNVFVPLIEKSVQETATHWILRGTATTPRTDRMNDIVRSTGAKFEQMPKLLLYHDAQKPIGNLTQARPTAKGIPFVAQIPKVAEPGIVRDRIDEAVHSVKYDLISYVSIGFNPIKYAPIDKRDPYGPQEFEEWDWLELSLVTIPANPDAVITGIKSLDDELRASRAKSAYAKSLAVPGRNTTTQRTSTSAGAAANLSKGRPMDSLQTQLTELRDARKLKVDRMAEIDGFTAERALDANESKEFDDISSEIPDLDRKIKLKEFQLVQISTATPVVDVSRAAGGSRAPMGFVRKQDPEDKFQGESFMRKTLCKVQATIDAREGNFRQPWEIAQEKYGKTHPNLVMVMRTGVPGAGSGSGEALAEFVAADNRYTGDFIDFLYKQTVFDRLPLREVPANVAIKGIDGAWTAYFVGESKGIPASQGSGSSTSTAPLKVAALTVLSNELIRDSSPSALQMARDGLNEAHKQKVDSLFLSATAASAGVAPAGILNGVSALPTAGNTAANALTDLGSLEDTFTLADYDADLVLIMRKTMAAALGRMRSTLGIYDFPGLTRNGGTLDGKTVYTGGNVGAGDIILLAPSEIWKIGDTGVQISVSDSAMIEQDTAPTGATDTPVAASATMVSMFQEESTAIKLVRSINWGKRRSGAVAWIGNATYGDATT